MKVFKGSGEEHRFRDSSSLLLFYYVLEYEKEKLKPKTDEKVNEFFKFLFGDEKPKKYFEVFLPPNIRGIYLAAYDLAFVSDKAKNKREVAVHELTHQKTYETIKKFGKSGISETLDEALSYFVTSLYRGYEKGERDLYKLIENSKMEFEEYNYVKERIKSMKKGLSVAGFGGGVAALSLVESATKLLTNSSSLDTYIIIPVMIGLLWIVGMYISMYRRGKKIERYLDKINEDFEKIVYPEFIEGIREGKSFSQVYEEVILKYAE